MTDRQSLFAVLVVVYLTECLLWVRRGGVVFRRGISGWTVQVEGELARNDRGDLHWAWPLPPFGGLAVSYGIPFSLGPKGFLNASGAAFHPSGRPLQTAAFLAWEEVRKVETEGRALKVNGAGFWRSDSPLESLRLGKLIQELRKADPSKRGDAIREVIRKSFDLGMIRSRIQSLESALGPVRQLSMAVAALVFVATPLAVTLSGWFPTLYIVVPLLFVMTGLLARLAGKAHRALQPEAEDERFRLLMTLFLSPAAAIRAVDPLQRTLLEEFHPAALGCVLLEGEARRRFLSQVWRDLRFPRLPECPLELKEAVETERLHREVTIGFLEEAARSVGIDPGYFGRAPQSSDPSHVRYCPRCESQFTASASVCRECGGRALIDLPASAQK